MYCALIQAYARCPEGGIHARVPKDRVRNRGLSICQNWLARPDTFQTEFTNFKDKFYSCPSNFLKIARTIFVLIIFQDFAAPSLQNDAFDLQTGRPVMESAHTVSRWTQRQNECACSSRMGNLTRRNGGIFKMPIVCFRFAGISPNQNR